MAIVPLYARIDNLDPVTGTRFTLESSEDFDFDQSLHVLSETRQQELAAQFKRKVDASYVEAKRSVVATQAKIPHWVAVALIILGWNEFMTVITTPLYLSVTLMIGAPLLALWYLNMLGVAQTVGWTAYDQTVVVGKGMLRRVVPPSGPVQIQDAGHSQNDNRKDMHTTRHARRSPRPQDRRRDPHGGEIDGGLELSTMEVKKSL